MKIAFSYQRQSLDDTSKQKHSIQNQAEELKRFAFRHGYQIEQTFIDYGSASNAGIERKALTNLLAALDNAPEAFLIIRDVTRLTRDIGDWKRLISPYLHRIRFCNSGDRTLSELELGLMLLVGQNESRILGERIKNGIYNSKLRARVAGTDWKWGNHTPEFSSSGRKAVVANADVYGARINKINSVLISAGFKTLRSRVEAFADMGIQSRRGKPITIQSLHRTLNRASSRGL
mgnify:CR=1 FL=1